MKFLANGAPIPGGGALTFDAGSQFQISLPEAGTLPQRADLLVGTNGEPARGNDTYNTDGTSQSIARSLKKNQFLNFNVLVQNDGTQTDSILVKAPAGDANATISYKLGKTDVTADVTGSGLTLSNLPSAGSAVLKVTVKAKKNGANFTGNIEAAGGDNAKDVVQFHIGPI